MTVQSTKIMPNKTISLIRTISGFVLCGGVKKIEEESDRNLPAKMKELAVTKRLSVSIKRTCGALLIDHRDIHAFTLLCCPRCTVVIHVIFVELRWDYQNPPSPIFFFFFGTKLYTEFDYNILLIIIKRYFYIFFKKKN